MASISNLKYIAQEYPDSFGWINKIPSAVISIIQGVLPVLALLVLNILLPIILRILAKEQGVQTGWSHSAHCCYTTLLTTYTGMIRELNVQSYFFAFSFVQLFLVVTVRISPILE